MQPAVPDEPQHVWASADADPSVGAYRQGTAASRWALARYLVGRVIAEAVGSTLYVLAGALVVLVVVLQAALHVTVLAVLVAVVAVIVLLLRSLLMAILRRLTAADVHGPIAERMVSLVSETRHDVFRELRRLGLPSHTVTLPLLAFRLVGRRRARTLEQLRDFDVDRAVPPARIDEMHMLLGGAAR